MSLLQKIEERKRAKIRAERNKKAAIATASIITGAVVGTIAGVLIAPKSGKETMDDVKEKSDEIKIKLRGNLGEAKERVQESKVKIREYLNRRKSENIYDDESENVVSNICEETSIYAEKNDESESIKIED
ncbi:MAG: YtxH domain-containing protein, partial [Clostridium sp.]